MGKTGCLTATVCTELVEVRFFFLCSRMSFWAYMLHCRGGAFYVGRTDDLDRRYAEHQSGAMPGFTADRLPVSLVCSKAFQTREEAVAAERRIKGWSRAKKLALIRGDWREIRRLARTKSGPSTGSGQTG